MSESECKPGAARRGTSYYEQKSVGSTSFYACEACPYMALAEDDIKFHLFTAHLELARATGLARDVQIPCPGCGAVFTAEDTLRSHLRTHHKMGFKDVRKMIRSLVQLALRDKTKLEHLDDTNQPASAPSLPESDSQDVKIPQVIEIVPDVVLNKNETLPNVTYISVDELHKMSTPNFEQFDPKQIIKEASINIVYGSEALTTSSQPEVPSSRQCNAGRMLVQSVPDLISSLQLHSDPNDKPSSSNSQHISDEKSESTIWLSGEKKLGRPRGSKTVGITFTKKNITTDNDDIIKQFGKRCSFTSCGVRLFAEDKYEYHLKCHQNGTFKCPECMQPFMYIKSLHMHLWKNHSIDMELPTCEICGYKTYHKNRLENIHKKIHGDVRYPCPSCGMKFKNTKQLYKHKVVHKNGPSSADACCNVCGRQFLSRRQARLHAAAVHDKLKPFACATCDYSAARKAELVLHTRIHTDEKPYSCDVCKYRSADPNAMRRHKRQHSKEAVYSCRHCSYTSIQSRPYKAHLASAHPDLQAEDVFSCPYCAFKSVNRDKYHAHLASHTPPEPLVSPPAPAWTIPSQLGPQPSGAGDSSRTSVSAVQCTASDNIPIELDDGDSEQGTPGPDLTAAYIHPTEPQTQGLFQAQQMITDLSKEESTRLNAVPEHTQFPAYSRVDLLGYLTAPATMSPAVPSHSSSANLTGFPIRLPSLRTNFTVTPFDKIPLPAPKAAPTIITSTQMLPVPSCASSPGGIGCEAPRKKPKISVKSNLILKGPDRVNMFHSQQKIEFDSLAEGERGIDLSGPVTFNNLISTQFMQLPPEPPRETAPIPCNASDPQLFAFEGGLAPRADPGYIKLEASVKQGPSPPPPLKDIKNEVKSDYCVLDQCLLDNVLGAGELYALAADAPPGDCGDVIEIDDNSEEHKLLPRFDLNFPLESLYALHPDFHLLDGDAEPDLQQYIHGKQDPMMNAPGPHKINVKNIELMKN